MKSELRRGAVDGESFHFTVCWRGKMGVGVGGENENSNQWMETELEAKMETKARRELCREKKNTINDNRIFH